MPKPKILIQLDPDPQASVFDAVVAVDAGVEHLLQHAGVTRAQVPGLVHGAIFTRGLSSLAHTALFIGGSDVAAGEELLQAVRDTFFGPMRVSVMLDANGANTTAAAAVLVAARHMSLTGKTALVLGGTGPVGIRAARLLAGQGAQVRLGSRSRTRAEQACQQLSLFQSGWRPDPVETREPDQVQQALEGVDLLIAAGAAGAQLVEEATWRQASVRVAIDLNAVPPAGIEGIAATDAAKPCGTALAYGAIGVGGTKMKIHKAAIEALFSSNDRVLDAEEILAIGQELETSNSS